MASRASKPAVPLYAYQKRWVNDRSRFKLAVKCTQIGYSFAASLEAVLDAIEQKSLWIVLSRGERQSLEFMQKVRDHAQALRLLGADIETTFFEKTDILQHGVKFPNGSRIIGLPAHPDTARGYTRNMILDEFAFHQQDKAIWAAAFGRISRGGLKLRVISTPNGQRGKYFEMAKELGLTDGIAPREQPVHRAGPDGSTNPWSGHWCDIYSAVEQGCPINVKELHEAIGDEDIWQQEYECVFHSDSENYIPLELIVGCESVDAWKEPPPGWIPLGPCYWGFDVGRTKDLSVLTLVEKLGDTCTVRMLREMPKATFALQEKLISDIVNDPALKPLRGCIDATGLGMEMAERLAAKFPGRVEPVQFTMQVKQDLAVTTKKSFEDRTIRIPDDRALRRDLNAVKKIITTAGNIRYDAERTEAGHADRFWSLALALHAADRGVAAACLGWDPPERAGVYDGRFFGDDEDRRPSIWDDDREPAWQGVFQR